MMFVAPKICRPQAPSVQAASQRRFWLGLAAVLPLVLAGCLSGSNDTATSGTTTVQQKAPRPATNRFAPANQCHQLAFADGRQLGEAGGRLLAGSAASAMPLFFKPTELGRYLLALPDGSLLSFANGVVASQATPSATADWVLAESASQPGFFELKNDAGQALAVAGDGGLALSATGTPFQLPLAADASQCGAFPEIATQSIGSPFAGTLPDGRVLGFADAHVHVSATDFLGGAQFGSPFHRFGVTEALHDCARDHGPNGRLDLVGNFFAGTPQATHDTQGWPTFGSWPARNSLTHEGMYYKWVERAWRSGLRVMVNELVENEVLCTLNSTAKLRPQDCNEMNSVYRQAEFMKQMQDYIDAQEGGPGEGWFRIVRSPAEARQVIAQGKLAVILGIEVSHVLNCNLKRLPGGIEQPGCDRASIDAEIEKLWNAGIRQLFPVHEFDNALGGNGIFNGDVLNVGNFIDTNQFWSTYDCPDTDYYFGAGAFMVTAGVPGMFGIFDDANPLSGPLRDLLNGTLGLPAYKADKKQCNTRRISELGKYAINRMMDRGIIIDVDHMELAMKGEVIDMALARKTNAGEPYPVTSTHGAQGGLTQVDAEKLFKTGGIIYDYKSNGQGYTGAVNKAREAHAKSGTSKFFAVGFGADTNGLGSQAGPRGSDREPIRYPFTLFQGPEWDPTLFAGATPITFDRQRSGERIFDIDKEGQAHYGLIADFVEEVRIEGGRDALNALYLSAERYLQMWEQALRVGPATAQPTSQPN